MGLTRTALATIAIIAIAVVSAASPSFAESESQTSGADASRDGDSQIATGTAATYRVRPNGNVLSTGIDASAPGGGRTTMGPGMPGWLRECVGHTWSYFDKEFYFANLRGATIYRDTFVPKPGNEVDDTWYYLICPNSPQALANSSILEGTGIFGTWKQDTRPPQVVLDAIVGRSIASVELPHAFGQGAPMGTEDIPFITQLPTWLWIDEANWQPRSVTPPPIFGITATATATPINVTFTGDNESVDCGPNLGPPYNFNLKENQQHSDCTLTYRHSSNVGNYTLSNTTTWAVTWTCNQFCGSGTAENMVVPSHRDVIVAELQAILVG